MGKVIIRTNLFRLELYTRYEYNNGRKVEKREKMEEKVVGYSLSQRVFRFLV